MALGADSLPGWRNRPIRDSQNSERENAKESDTAENGATENETGDDADATAADSTTAAAKGNAQPDAQTASTTTGGGSENEPVVVWQASNRLEAQIVKGRLESHGVPAFLSGEALGTIYGLTTGNLAATSVLVPGPLAEKALEILNSEVVWDDAVWELESGETGAEEFDAHGTETEFPEEDGEDEEDGDQNRAHR